MSKTITIDSCSVCHFAMLQPNYLRPSTPYCAKNNTIRDSGTAIPSWCPLPDTQEQGRSKTGANITKCGHGTPSYTACRACQVEVSKIEIDAYMSAQENKP